MGNVALVIMDGIGISAQSEGNMVLQAYTPTLDSLMKKHPMCKLAACGCAVGLPSESDMGNSEVGHNTLGCGQIYAQGAKLVDDAIRSGKMFAGKGWNEAVENCIQNQSALHFIGLLSDGNVHSNMKHLIIMLRKAKSCGIRRCCIHVILDGRDVPAQSALRYIDMLEKEIAILNSETFHACIASGGGRMCITMDRYNADWEMVKRGWDAHVRGIGCQFASAKEAVLTYRKAGCTSDQYLPPFVMAEDRMPVGKICDGDSVILFNFRGDRAIELAMAFEKENFAYFNRGRKPDVVFLGMLQYDGDRKIPEKYLVNPPEIKNTLTEVLSAHQIKQYAVSETQKYGHVTYFWNGNRSGKVNADYEVYEEIPSDNVPFEQRPWMKAAEIADRFIAAIESREYRFMRCNFANADMVGHTGNLQAVRIAVESIDLQLARIVEACERTGTILLITADHGNADQMIDKNSDGTIFIRTAHSLNPVPFIICAPDSVMVQIKEGHLGLANVAPTILHLLQVEAPACWEESITI